MQKQEIKQEKMSADVLIIGGGIAGLTAAISVKEENPDISVLVVEKQTSGYSGKANKGGGVLQYFDLEKTTPEMFNEYHANAVGGYLANQNLLKKYVAMNNELLDKMESWGVNIPKKRIPTGPMTYMVGVDLDLTLKMRATATKLGVKFIDKTTISDLLTRDGKIAGAVGYSIIDGTFYVFEGKSVILCTGSQNYRVAPMWSNGRGDGIAAAYRAGAQMRNPEHSFTAYTATVSVYLARTLCTMLMVKILQRTSAVSRKQISVPVPLLSGTIPWLPAEARFTCIRWRARQPKMIR